MSIEKVKVIGEMSSSFDVDEVWRVSSSPFGYDEYLGFDPHISSQSCGSYTTFAVDKDVKSPIQISTNGSPPLASLPPSAFIHEYHNPSTLKGYNYIFDRHSRFSFATFPFLMLVSNGSSYGEGVNDGVFISDGPILPPLSKMRYLKDFL